MMLDTPTRTNANAAELKVGDVLLNVGGLRYRVMRPPVPTQKNKDGSPAEVSVAVEGYKSGLRNTLYFEAETSLLISRVTP